MGARAVHLALSLILASATSVQADRAVPFECSDERTKGWNFYCETPPVEEEPEAETAPPSSPPAPPSYTERMEEYRRVLDELKHRAILEPTPEHVEAYMRAQNAMVKQATLFTEVWQRQVFSNPDLDRNVKRPLTSVGGNLYQDELDIEREDALRAAASEHALMFVYEGGADCYLCATQADILVQMQARHGVHILPVAKDGVPLGAYPDSATDTGQLAEFGLKDTPVPFVALVEPRAGTVDLVGAGLMTEDILIDRIRIITAIPEGELYE